MAWNWETGRDEPDAYAAGSGPLYSPPAASFWGRAAKEVWLWENLETELKRKRWNFTPTTVFQAWGAAEMAVIGWDKAAQTEDFRRGYMEWLASTSGAQADTLSDLEIEQLPLLERIVARGFREMAKTEHPDTGGTEERFRDLRDGKRQLDRMLQEVGEILKS